MDHSRKQIRDAIKTVLTGLATTSNNIFYDYVYAINKLPALVVFTRAETIENKTIGKPRVQERTLQIDITGIVKTNTNYQDTVDKITEEVETAIYNSSNLSGLVKFINLLNIETEYNDDLEQPLGSVKLSYSVTYIVRENDVTTIIN